MAGWEDVTTYEQLQAMSPEERHQHFLDSVVWKAEDLTQREHRLLEEQRQRLLAREARLRGKAS